jgi:hypothetical protein
LYFVKTIFHDGGTVLKESFLLFVVVTSLRVTENSSLSGRFSRQEGLFCFQVRSQNCDKQLFASLCLSIRPPARPHGTWLPLNGFSLNLMFYYFSNFCLEKSSSNKI